MTGVNGGPTPYTLEDWMRRVEKRVLNQERRPIPRRAADLLGPGIASRTVELMDWSSEDTLFNGFFHSEPGALNSPDPIKYWMGMSLATAEGYGQQVVWEYRDATDAFHTEYIRTFAPAGVSRTFTPWVSLAFDTGWQELTAATGWTKQVAQWRRIGNVVHLRFRMLASTAVAYSTTGNITGDPPVVNGLPSAVWPAEHTYVIGSAGGRGMTGYVSNLDGITRLQAIDGYGTASTLAVGGSLAGDATWFI